MANIYELLTKLHEMDEELVDFEFESHEELVKNTQEKIDAYYEVRSRLQAELVRLDSELDAMKTRKARVESRLDRLMNYLQTAMEVNSVTAFPGNKYTVKMVSRKLVRPKLECNRSFYEEQPEYCLRKEEFKWNRDRLLDDYRLDHPAAKALCEEYDSKHLRFTIK